MRAVSGRMGVLGSLFVIVPLLALSCSSKVSSIGGSGGGSGSGSGGSNSATGGSGSGSGGSGTPGTAIFNVKITQSSAIATVEAVAWSVNVSIDSAVINFGRDQSNFEFQAPVDQTQAPNYQTLLLGMKQNTKYYVQIVAQGGGQTYTSDVENVTTGYLANGVPAFTVTDMNASALYAGGGFTVGCTGLAGIPGQLGTTKTYIFIIDKDGALVWVLDASNNAAVSNCSRARMSY